MGEMGLRASAAPFVGMSNETFDAEAFPIIKLGGATLQRFSCCYRLFAQCEVASALLIDD